MFQKGDVVIYVGNGTAVEFDGLETGEEFVIMDVEQYNPLIGCQNEKNGLRHFLESAIRHLNPIELAKIRMKDEV